MNRLLTRVNSKLSLSNATLMLIGMALMGQILGFFRNRLVSANFREIDPGGTDAFFTAFLIPDFFFLTIAAGTLGVAFVPVLMDKLSKGDRKGMWEVTSSILNMLTIVMFFVGVGMMLFAESMLQTIAGPKLSPQDLDKAVNIMRLVALNPLLFTLAGVLTSVQQTFGRFFFYALAPLLYNLSIIVSIYVFKADLGVIGLGVGAVIGASLQFLMASFGLIGLGFKYIPRINPRTTAFKQIIRALPARSIDQGIDQINTIVETNRATHLYKGAAADFNFAMTLMNVPVILFGTTISTAIFPRLTARLSQNRPDLFHRDFFRVLRLLIWIALPVAVVGYFARAYLARILYADSAPMVSLIFGYLTIAIVFRIIYTILSRYFYAQKDTRTPLLVSFLAIGLNIFLAFRLAAPGAYSVAGLAIAQSVTAAVEVVVLFLIMFIRDRYLLNKAFWGSILRIVSVTGFTLVTGYIMAHLFPLQATDTGFITLVVKLSLIAVPTLLVHVFVSLLFGLDEPRPAINKVRQIIMRPVKIEV